MDRNAYYYASRAEILKRLTYIQKEDIVDFFEESDSFSLALYLAYFALAEEVLIERNSHDGNIHTRLKTHIDQRKLAELFRNPDLIKIYDKEIDGNTAEWFIATLRNGIIHKGPAVDYSNKKVYIENDGYLNKLKCEVSFDWFRNFILDDLLLHSTIGKYNYTSFIAPYKDPRDVDFINNFDDIRNFIDNELLAYSINIKHKSGEEISRSEFLEFCREKESSFWGYLFAQENLDEEKKAKFREYEIHVINAIGTPNNMNADEYRRLFNNTFYKAWFIADFKKKYPGYEVSVDEFERLNPKYSLVISGLSRNEVEKRMFGSYRKTQHFFNNLHPAIQRMEIATCLSRLINEDKVDYISHMQYLFTIYDMYKGCGKNEYGLAKFIKRMNNPKHDAFQIKDDYAQEIYDRLSKKGIIHTYDKQITDMIIGSCNSKEDAVYKRCRALIDGHGDFSDEEYYNHLCEVLKNEFPEFYEEESEKRKECGVFSDQVQEIFDEEDLYRLCNAMYVFKEQKDDIIIALLYALGINTYVVNKEMTFKDELVDSDYDFMDSLDIVGYSKDRYTFLEDLRKRKSNLTKHKNRIDANKDILEKLNEKMRIDPDDPTKLMDLTDYRLINNPEFQYRLALIDQRNNESLRVELESNDCEACINSIQPAEFNGVKMGSLENSQCATTIRNCFSHGGRIFVDSKKTGGEIRLVLTDYDEKGNLSGVVQTNLESLIKFFSHKTFYNVMNQRNEENVTAIVVDPVSVMQQIEQVEDSQSVTSGRAR